MWTLRCLIALVSGVMMGLLPWLISHNYSSSITSLPSCLLRRPPASSSVPLTTSSTSNNTSNEHQSGQYSIEDVLVIMMSCVSLPERREAALSTWLKYFPNKVVSSDGLGLMPPFFEVNYSPMEVCQGSDEPNVCLGDYEYGNCFRTMRTLEMLIAYHRLTPWILLVDDDSFVIPSRLLRHINDKQWDHHQSMIVGRCNECTFRYNQKIKFMCPTGGAGILFTGAFLDNAMRSLLARAFKEKRPATVGEISRVCSNSHGKVDQLISLFAFPELLGLTYDVPALVMEDDSFMNSHWPGFNSRPDQGEATFHLAMRWSEKTVDDVFNYYEHYKHEFES